MGDALTGVRAARLSWRQRIAAFLNPAPKPPPAWHAPRPVTTRPRDTRPGRHRAEAGGAFVIYQRSDGSELRWRRRL